MNHVCSDTGHPRVLLSVQQLLRNIWSDYAYRPLPSAHGCSQSTANPPRAASSSDPNAFRVQHQLSTELCPWCSPLAFRSDVPCVKPRRLAMTCLANGKMRTVLKNLRDHAGSFATQTQELFFRTIPSFMHLFTRHRKKRRAPSFVAMPLLTSGIRSDPVCVILIQGTMVCHVCHGALQTSHRRLVLLLTKTISSTCR